MPRINIEESVFSTISFSKLIISLGERQRAIGAIVELWITAQKYWLPDKNLIPAEEFKSIDNWKLLLDCRFAEERDNGFYAKGAEKHFQWWFNKQAAGRNGGLAKASSAKQKASTAKLLVPSFSSSSSFSSSEHILALRAVNEVLGKEFRPVKANLKFIACLLADGSTVQDLVDVAKIKQEQWGGDDAMRKYLRPKTLFNRTNFESYLSELADAKIQREKYNEFL